MRLIYSFNPYDPSGDTAPLQKHTVKGSKSVYLLSPTRDEPTLPSDAFSMDLLMSNVNTNANLNPYLDYSHMRLSELNSELNNDSSNSRDLSDGIQTQHTGVRLSNSRHWRKSITLLWCVVIVS